MVKLTTDTGVEINVRVSAINQAEAIKKITSNNAIADAISEHGAIKKIDVDETDSTPLDFINPHEFMVIQSPKNPNRRRCIDMLTDCWVEWEVGNYSKTALSNTPTDWNGDAVETATAMRRIGDYLAAYHYNILFETSYISIYQMMGQQIKTRREELGMTTGEFAGVVGQNEDRIIDIENGKVAWNKVGLQVDIATALGCQWQLVPVDDEELKRTPTNKK